MFTPNSDPQVAYFRRTFAEMNTSEHVGRAAMLTPFYDHRYYYYFFFTCDNGGGRDFPGQRDDGSVLVREQTEIGDGRLWRDWEGGGGVRCQQRSALLHRNTQAQVCAHRLRPLCCLSLGECPVVEIRGTIQ